MSKVVPGPKIIFLPGPGPKCFFRTGTGTKIFLTGTGTKNDWSRSCLVWVQNIVLSIYDALCTVKDESLSPTIAESESKIIRRAFLILLNPTISIYIIIRRTVQCIFRNRYLDLLFSEDYWSELLYFISNTTSFLDYGHRSLIIF